MDRMPYTIKVKLRQLQKAVEKVSSIQYELTEMIEKYDIDIDLFTALADVRVNEKTEALSYILNDECNDVTDEFWKRYEEIGRCLFIGHNSWYQDDNNTRFTYTDENTRTCNWCGKTEHKRVEEIIRHKDVWE